MALSTISPVVNRGIISNWLEDLPAAVEMLTVDTDGNVSHQVIPVASFGALTGAPGDNAALASALDGKAPVSHTHVIADTTGLQAALDAKLGGSTGSIDNRILRADGTGGATVQNSAVTIDDSGNISGLGSVGCGAITASGLLSIDHAPSGTDARLLQVRRSGSDRFAVGLEYSYDNYFGDPSGITCGRSQYGNGYIAVAKQAQIFVWANTGIQLRSGLYYGISGSTFDQVNAGYDTADVKLSRGTSGPTWDARAAGGLRVRNLANNADAALTAGAITASGAIAASSGTALVLHTNSTERMRIDTNGNVGIGQSNPTVGLVIRRSGADLPSLRLEDGDITVPFTSLPINPLLNANTVGNWAAAASASGGCSFSGWTNNTAAAYPLMFAGYHGSTAPTKPALNFSAFKSNGGSDAASLASSELIAGFYNGSAAGTPIVTFSASGTIAAASAAFTGLVSVGTYTVATLPSAAANAGALAQVTDSSVTANGSAVAGGGSNRVVVFSNGSTWDVVVA